MAFPESAGTLRARLHLSAAHPAALGLLVVIAAILMGAAVALAGALAPPAFEVRAGDGAAMDQEARVPASEPEPAAPSLVYVHVGGAVASPGVYAVEEGARVDDAVAAAGGLTADAAPDAVNRARVVADGEQVVIPTVQELEQAPLAPAEGGGGGASASPAGGGGPVNLNRATAAELTTLSGIGEATAAKIIADREANGPFATVDDLMRVPGIGEKKLAALRDAVCV